MSEELNKAPPSNCRQQLAADGKPYPRSSCAVCGQFSPRWKECDASLAATPVPPARGDVEVLAVVTLGGYFSAEELGDIDIEPRMAVLEQIQQEVVTTDADEHLELVDRAHVTRLQEGLKLEQDATIKWQETAITLSAERDALKAESKSLAELDDQTIKRLGDRLRESQSELTKARELLSEPRELVTVPADWFDRRDAFIAHQFAPAAKCARCGASTVEHCDDKGCGYLGAGNGAPAAKGESDE